MKPKNTMKSVAGQSKHPQRGVVLFIALIALLVMSLAAAALIRSVDTSTIIAGNLASKQTAINSADSGVETALNQLSLVTNLSLLDSDQTANGYYATQALDPKSLAWDNTDSIPAQDGGAGTIDANGKDATGNTIRVIVQRMCRNAGAPSEANCLLGAPAVGTGSSAVKEAPQAGAVTETEQSPVYRITARVVGVKNTISYVQAFAY
jgi:type IV pilus assembly protein PilX